MSKTTVAIIVLALLLCLALAGIAISVARLETARESLSREEVAHNATKSDYARDGALWLKNQRTANSTILGLQGQVNATQANKAAEREAEARRFDIFMSAVPMARPEEVVDDATSDKIVTHINDAYSRAGRVCGAASTATR